MRADYGACTPFPKHVPLLKWDAAALSVGFGTLPRRVRLSDGTVCHAEIHWYEAGIGMKDLKIKRLFEAD